MRNTRIIAAVLSGVLIICICSVVFIGFSTPTQPTGVVPAAPIVGNASEGVSATKEDLGEHSLAFDRGATQDAPEYPRHSSLKDESLGESAIAESAPFESNAVLVELREGISAPELVEALTVVEGVHVGELSEDDLASRYVRLELDEGLSVEDAINRLHSAGDAIVAAQPNYIYTVMDSGTAATLKADLEAALSGDGFTPEMPDPSHSASDHDDSSRDSGNEELDLTNPSTNSSAAQSADASAAQSDLRSPIDGNEVSYDATSADLSTTATEKPPTTDPSSEGAIIDEAAAREVTQDGHVEEAQGNSLFEALSTYVSVNDPYAQQLTGSQWMLSSMRVYEAWAMARAEAPLRGAKVGIAVLDTGFDITHEDLQANIVAPYNSRTGQSSAADLRAGAQTSNPRHGTHVAGIASAVTNNGIGVAGVSYNARLMPIRVTDDTGAATSEYLIKAYNYLIARAKIYNIRVVNLSMGTKGTIPANDAFLKKIDEADAAGIVTVAAAGNEDRIHGLYRPYECYPSDYAPIVSVINLMQVGNSLELAATSNYNKPGETNKRISAPGTNVMSTVPNNRYEMMSGTSMAAPAVAGVLALEFAINPSLTAAEARQNLYMTAKDIGDAGFDEKFGYGEVDAANAVTNLLQAEQQRQEIERVRALIASLPAASSITLNDKQMLSEVRAAYNALSAAQKELIDITALVAAENRITELERIQAEEERKRQQLEYVRNLIAALPAPSQLTLEDRSTVRAVRSAFDNLDAAQQARLDITALLAAEKRIEELELAAQQKAKPPSVAYQAHVQDIDWMSSVRDGALCGTTQKGLRLEALRLSLTNQVLSGAIQYRAYISGNGWQSWKENGAIAGTVSQSLSIEAFEARLTGTMSTAYDLWYCAHVQDVGWMGWTKNGAVAGTTGYGRRVEAIMIQLVSKGGAAPGSTALAYKSPIAYQAHVQNIGWQTSVRDGELSGTQGRALRLEALRISLPNMQYSGTIQYRGHVSNRGWERTWKENGAMSGTNNQSLSLEAIEIRLTGELASRYDVWYRVHAQDFGWMGWTKNGNSAGSSGYARQLEAVQILLVEKNGAAPGSTAGAFRAG